MAECSVHEVSVWPYLQRSYQGMLNLSAASTLTCKVENLMGSGIISGRGLRVSKGHDDPLELSKSYIVGSSCTMDHGPFILKDDDDIGTLIPGLPDDIAKSCIAMVPRGNLPAMGCVAKSWKVLLQSREFQKIRRDMGNVEEWLYALTRSEDHKRTNWQVFSPLKNEWKLLPRMPGPLKSGSGCAVIDGKLLVVGGAVEGSVNSAVADVVIYDSLLNRWRKGASMHTPRYEFASAVLDGFLYVVGGRGLGGINLPSVEVYDPQRDMWTKLPSLKRARWGGIGCGLEGKLYVMAGRSSFTIGHSRCVDVYDPSKGQWEETKNGCMMVLTHATVDRELYCIEWKDARKLAVFSAAENSWKRVTLPLAGSLSVGFCLVNLSGKVLLLPTTTEALCDTLVYNPRASGGSEWQTVEIRPLGACICCTTIEA